MGIPATIEFLSSLRSSFQLLAIKNRIKTTTEKPKGMKLKFCSKYFYENIKTSVQGNFDSEKKKKIIIMIKLQITGATAGYF